MALNGMAWAGGKATDRHGPWLHSLLPPVERNQTYIEPFAGMLGIMLRRARADHEIVNDLDGRVINWWTVVREQPDELARAIAFTPNGRAEYMAAAQAFANGNPPDGLEGARLFSVAVLQSMARTIAPNSWRIIKRAGSYDWSGGIGKRLNALADRIRWVALECGDAVDVVRQYDDADAVIYLDPPYIYRGDELYAHDVDRGALFSALRDAKSRCAISGYADEWDELGWQRHECATKTNMGAAQANKRIEVLWTNYDPPQRLL